MWEICLVGTTPVGWVMGWGSSFMRDDIYCGRSIWYTKVRLTEFEGKVKFGETKKYDSA